MVIVHNFVVTFIIVEAKVVLQMLAGLNFLGSGGADEIDLRVVQNFFFFVFSQKV